jgi:hypothetical protein
MSEQILTKEEKQKAAELLDELTETKGPGRDLENWTIRAKTLLVFIVMRNPELIFDANNQK